MNQSELNAARDAIIRELVQAIKLLNGDAIQNPYHLQELAADAGKLRTKVTAATLQ